MKLGVTQPVHISVPYQADCSGLDAGCLEQDLKVLSLLQKAESQLYLACCLVPGLMITVKAGTAEDVKIFLREPHGKIRLASRRRHMSGTVLKGSLYFTYHPAASSTVTALYVRKSIKPARTSAPLARHGSLLLRCLAEWREPPCPPLANGLEADPHDQNPQAQPCWPRCLPSRRQAQA